MVINNLTVYLKKLRESYDYTITKVANGISVSAPFLSDVEKGNRIPTRKVAKFLIDFYNLDEDQKRKLYDAIAEVNDSLPYDVVDYLKANPQALQHVIKLMNKDKTKSIK